MAILREPLVPCAAITSPQDCIFGQAQPFLTSVIGAAAALARLARSVALIHRPSADLRPEEDVHLLYRLLKAYYEGDAPPPPEGLGHYWAAVAAVLLNCIFTSGHRMAELVIADEFARAKAWWAPFARPQEHLNPWVHASPLLVLLSKINGSLDLPLATYDQVWAAVHRLITSATWLHASPDGLRPPLAPSPLAGLRAASHVRAEHVTPTFVGKTGDPHTAKPATACVVGLMPMGFQQLLALLQGASADPTVMLISRHGRICRIDITPLRRCQRGDLGTMAVILTSDDDPVVGCCNGDALVGISTDRRRHGRLDASSLEVTPAGAEWNTQLPVAQGETITSVVSLLNR